MSDREITATEVEAEHLAEVHRGRQWAYIIGVIGLGLVAMLGLIALMGTASV
jgi:hypothetical protein